MARGPQSAPRVRLTQQPGAGDDWFRGFNEPMTERLEARLRRLEEEREEADRRYNQALTELDRALPRGAADPALPVDDQQLPALNDAWNIVPAPPSSSGLKQKITGFIWRTVGPYFQRQLTFNSLLVDHLNRNAEALKRARAQETSATRAQLDAIAAFHARLLAYLQKNDVERYRSLISRLGLRR